MTGRPEPKPWAGRQTCALERKGCSCTCVVSWYKRPAEEKGGQDAQLRCRQKTHCVTQGEEVQQEGRLLFRLRKCEWASAGRSDDRVKLLCTSWEEPAKASGQGRPRGTTSGKCLAVPPCLSL